jgi:hypothetical protein
MAQGLNIWRISNRYTSGKVIDEPIIFDNTDIPAGLKVPHLSNWVPELRHLSQDPCQFDDESIFVWCPGSVSVIYGDQSIGYRCDREGAPNTTGRYWALLHDNQRDYVVFSWRKTKIRSLSEMRSIEWDPVTSAPLGKMNMKRAKKNLNKTIARLELSYLDAVKLIKLNEKVKTACWFYNPKTGEEGIFINPILAQKSPLYVEFLIKHEVMHRAIYRGMRGCRDWNLVNIALDICINRVLCQNRTGTRYRRFMTFARWIYPKDSRKNFVALANPTMVPSELKKLHKDIVRLWMEIWGGFKNFKGEFRDRKLPSLANLRPLSIYYQLKKIQDDGNQGEGTQITVSNIGNNDSENMDDMMIIENDDHTNYHSPFDPCNIDGPEIPFLRNPNNQETSTSAGERMEQVVKTNVLSGGLSRAARRISAHQSALADLAAWWQENIPTLDEIRARELEVFAKKMRTVQLISAVKARLEEHLKSQVRQDPYPELMTEETMLLVACGLVPPFLYENQEPSTVKKRVAVYFDLSPSMMNVIGHIPGILDVLENRCDIEYCTSHTKDERGGYVFAGDVKEVDAGYINDMRNGRLKIVGPSTCFDVVINHAIDKIEQQNVDIILLVTDGLSVVGEQNIRRFNTTKKKCFSIILTEEGQRDAPYNSGLGALRGEVCYLDLPKHDASK